MDCHFLLQGIFPTQELNPGLLHCREILYQLSYKGEAQRIHYYGRNAVCGEGMNTSADLSSVASDTLYKM